MAMFAFNGKIEDPQAKSKVIHSHSHEARQKYSSALFGLVSLLLSYSPNIEGMNISCMRSNLLRFLVTSLDFISLLFMRVRIFLCPL